MNDSNSSARHFNTALITTKLPKATNFNEQFQEVSNTPEFQLLLDAVGRLAETENISLELAAEKMITMFRKVDKLWENYIFYEGLEKLRSNLEVTSGKENRS